MAEAATLREFEVDYNVSVNGVVTVKASSKAEAEALVLERVGVERGLAESLQEGRMAIEAVPFCIASEKP